MSHDRAGDVVERLRSNSLFAAFVAEVEATIGPPIRTYAAARADQPLPQAKALKDAVWGMIDLTPNEVVLLDSPVLQRLRRVRQLGVTYLTYPTAGYSRFEHTLGATHQAERMLRAIEQRSQPPMSDALRRATHVVRLATLLHDLGHMPFSHVSERYYSAEECRDTELARNLYDLRTAVAKTIQVPQPRLSEILSLAVASSPSMRQLVIQGARYTEEDLATATLAIVGRPPSLRQAFIAQVVSNVIDADKLDYMFRDAFVTRVPLAVDLERLLFKLRCLDVPARKLPPIFQEMATEHDSGYVLGTDLAGFGFAHDLSLSRAMLYDRIYLHHKTRAAERVVLRIFGELDFSPVQLLQHDDELLGPYGPAQGVCPQLIAMLSGRTLPRRCYAMTYSRLVKEATTAHTGRTRIARQDLLAWQRLERDLTSPVEREAIRDAVLAKMATLRSGLEPAEVDLWVDSQPHAYELDISELLVSLPDGTTDRGSSFPSAASAFTRSPEALSFIYISGDLSQQLLAYVATELVVADRYQLFFGRDAADQAKVDVNEVDGLKRDLEAQFPALYRHFGRLRPTSWFVRTEAARDRLEQLATRFGHYHGTADVHLDVDRLRRYLDQFPEALVEPMLRVLEGIVYLDRADLAGLVNPLEAALPEAAVMVPLTVGTEKSAAHIGYYFEDYSHGRSVLDLRRALATDDPIVFYDDCLLSGTQASEVVAGWFGEEPDDPGLAEVLSAEEQALLRTRQPLCRFAYARSDGLVTLREALARRGVSADVTASREVATGSQRLEEIVGDETADRLRAFLREVGRELLLTTKGAEDPARWPPEKCDERALGYGGLEELVVTLYNTPTATITALWKSGLFRGVQWLPLFPRRHEASDVT